jgi:hypothetical protein
MPETLSPYWQQAALDLINTRHQNPLDPDALAKWIGGASAVMAEALRASGNYDGIDAIIGVLGGTDA